MSGPGHPLEEAGANARRSPPFELVVAALNAALAAVFLVQLFREVAAPAQLAATDFTVFRTGWWLILHGRVGELYDPVAQAAVQRALMSAAGSAPFAGGFMAFLHPPHAALAGCALGEVAAHFGAQAAFCLWTAVNLALLARLVVLVRDELGGGARATALVGTALAGFYPVFETLRQGQLSLLLAVAALGLARAVRGRRAALAALWLLVLSLKPQTLPVLLAVLAVRRERRVLAFAAVLAVAVFAVTSLALGPHVWLDYLARAPGLERFFGAGTPMYMPTLRGLLTRLFHQPSARPLVDRLTLLGWAAATAAAAWLAARAPRPDSQPALAVAFSFGLLASPHLFPQDALLWVAPVTLLLSGWRQAEPAAWRQCGRLALVWPVWFVLARAVDVGGGAATPRLPFDPTIVPMLVILVWSVRAVRTQGPPPGTQRDGE